MRKIFDSDAQSTVWGFTPLFVSAVLYAAIIRILNIYLMLTSDLIGYALFWLDPVIGFLSLGDLILCTAVVFFGLSIFELKGKFRSPTRWVTMMTCLLLVLYTVFFGLNVRSLADI